MSLAAVVLVVLGYLAVKSLGVQMREAVAQLQQNNDLETTSTSAEEPKDLRATVESLALRFETLHEECLRYVRKGSSSLQRAKRLNNDEFEDEDLDVDDQAALDQMVMPLAEAPAKRVPMDPIQFRLQRQMRKGAQNGA